jgi:hypothetical protein
MNTRNLFTKGLAAILMTIGLSSMSHAVLITTNGVFTNLVGTGALIGNVQGDNTNLVSWGNGTTSGSNEQSSWEYNGLTNFLVDINNPSFNFGEFTHTNRPITSAGSFTADFVVNVLITTDDGLDTLANETFTYGFLHDETLNQEPCTPFLAGNVCPDVVSVPDASEQIVFLLGADRYLDIVGFLPSGGGTIIPELVTGENTDQTAGLIGGFVNVSEPGTLGLLALSLFCLSSLRRRVNS